MGVHHRHPLELLSLRILLPVFSHSTALRQCCFIFRYRKLIDIHRVLCQTERDL